MSNSLFSKTFLFSFKQGFDDSYTLWASGPLSGRPFYEQMLIFTKGIWWFYLKPSILLREFDTFRSWVASGAPLGSLGSFLGSSLDFSGWISGLGSFLGSFLDASGPVFIFFQSFWTSLGNMFLNFKHHFLFYIEWFFKFVFLFIIFLFYVAVCDVAWSAELPEGSIFMF